MFYIALIIPRDNDYATATSYYFHFSISRYFSCSRYAYSDVYSASFPAIARLSNDGEGWTHYNG